MRATIFVVALLAISVAFVTAQLENSDMLTVCPNGHQCQSGSRCSRRGTALQPLMDNNALEDYLCDCAGRAGQLCEYAPEVYCVKGQGAASTNSFCVNEGRCVSVASDDNPSVLVAGCECTEAYEGNHCQYLKGSQNSGTNNTDNNGGNPGTGTPAGSGNTIRSADGGSLSTGAIVGIAVGAFVVTICLACVVKYLFSKRDEPPSVVVGDDQEQGGYQDGPEGGQGGY